MRSVIIFFLLLCFFHSSKAQNPTFDWAKRIGSTTSVTSAIKTVSDVAGNVFVMGLFSNTVDIDPGPAVFNITSSGATDVYITKSDANGNFLWVKQIGNLAFDDFRSMNIDNFGNLYFTGSFTGVLDVDPGPAIFNLITNNAVYATFLLRLDNDGNFVWARKITETEFGSRGTDVAITATGDVYVSGEFMGTGDFDPGPSVLTLSSTGPVDDIFISKLDVNGNLIWVKQISGFGAKNCYSMSIDALDNIYITGVFYNTCDFDPGNAVFNLTASTVNSSDAYILKLDLNGQFVFAKQLSSNYNVVSSGIKVNQMGDIFVTGNYDGIGDFDPGPGTFILTTTSFYSQAFILKLDQAGNFVWAKQFESGPGPISSSQGWSISLDNFGNVYTLGTFTGAVDFDPSPASFILNTPSQFETYISKLDPAGNFIFSLQLVSSDFNSGISIFVDAQRNITVAGTYKGITDFDPTAGFNILSSIGINDMYFLKLKQPCAQSTTFNINATACNSYTLNNQLYSNSGTYIQTITNTAGCDSIITLNLTIGGSSNTVSVISCDSYFWEGETYTSSGTYIATYLDANGCDSILTLNLEINQSITTSITESICEGQILAGYSTAGIYTDTFTRVNGCDSIRTLNLSVKLKSVVSLNSVICEGQTFEGYSSSGTYIDTFIAANGCDSVRKLNLIVNPKKITTINASICSGQTYFAAGNIQTTSGIYRDSLKTSLNCDSIIITNLVVHPKPRPDLGQDKNVCEGSVLVLNPGSFRSYVWQDQSTSPTYNTNSIGLYYVTVTDNNSCTGKDSIRINSIIAQPTNFLKKSDSLCQYEQLLLQPTKNYSSYLWSTGAFQRNISIQNAGQYWLQVTDVNGCKGLDTIRVIAKTCNTGVYIPTAFTPNGDGINDFFKATVLGKLITFKLALFNRYGEIVFQTTDPQKKWDGIYKGYPFSTNSFVWQCKYQLEGEKPVNVKGHLVLIR